MGYVPMSWGEDLIFRRSDAMSSAARSICDAMPRSLGTYRDSARNLPMDECIDCVQSLQLLAETLTEDAEAKSLELAKLRAQLGRLKVQALRHALDASTMADLRAAKVAATLRAEQAEISGDEARQALASCRAGSERAGYRRAIDDACRLIGDRAVFLWADGGSTTPSPQMMNGVLAIVRALAPVPD